MANNYASGTFEPFIPKHLFTEADLNLLDSLGITANSVHDADDVLYLFNEDYCTTGYLETETGEKEVTEDDLYALLQEVIRRSNGSLKWISHEQAYTCDKMRRGEFGGSAVFITADDIQYHGTSSWLERRIAEAESSDTGPDTEDPDAITNEDVIEAVNDLIKAAKVVVERWESGNLAEAVTNLDMVISWTESTLEESKNKPHPDTNLAIVIDGGLVQAVVTDNPAAFRGVNTVVIDYDTDYVEPDYETLGLVPQGGGNLKSAYIRATSIDAAGIDLKRTADFVTDKACGANRERFAICGKDPCDDCKDRILNGGRCVNEDKCLAWQYYFRN